MEKSKNHEPVFSKMKLDEPESTERILARFIEAENSLLERITELIERSREAIESSHRIIGKIPLRK